MFLTDISIKRPVFATVMSIILIIFGLVIFNKIAVRELPDIDPSIVTVRTVYKGASAEIVDSQITQKIEDIVGGTPGLATIDSRSEDGRSVVKMEFEPGVSVDEATNDIRDRVSRIIDNLPDNASRPEIFKTSEGNQVAIWLRLRSKNLNDLDLSDYASRYLKDYFSSESFVSDKFSKDKERNNKHGQVNIYTATNNGGKWTNIKPLAINSGNYSCSNPSLSKDEKTLYFTSNMPGGLGGNDIWKVALESDGKLGTPENLGDKVNTEGDESFPFIDEKGILFFASNGKPGLGGLDIFAIDLAKGTDAVNLGKPVNTEKDDFAFTYNSAKKLGFLSSNRAGVDNIYMAQPICGVQAIVKVTDAKTGTVLANATVAILDEKGNIITKSYTNENGEVNYPVLCDKKYSVQVAKEGYENGTFDVPASGDGEILVNVPLQPIEAIVTPTEVILAPIVFDYDKSNITQEAAFILDNLVQVMNNNLEMVIDVRSHTDNRGSDAYNLRLSDRRAKSTVQYVISKGIKADRIKGKGYGESTPKVNCKEKCTEAEHQINRRSEFMIVKK